MSNPFSDPKWEGWYIYFEGSLKAYRKLADCDFAIYESGGIVTLTIEGMEDDGDYTGDSFAKVCNSLDHAHRIAEAIADGGWE